MTTDVSGLEADRTALIKDRDDDSGEFQDRDWRANFAPGTFGCHEAMHTAMLYQEVVDDLAEQPAIILDQEWYRLARQASESLAELYQAIGRKHVDDAR